MSFIIPAIIQKIKEAQNETLVFEEVYNSPVTAHGKNEFLFFIKPEITLKSDKIKLEAIINLIFNKIAAYNLKITTIKILSAKYLEKYDIIAQHYGVINKLSKNAKTNISEDGKAKFQSVYNINVGDANVLGSLQFIQEYPCFNASSLNTLCQKTPSEKIAGGTYVQKMKIEGEDVYLVNGFHPLQLEHFTAPGRSIVVFLLTGDLDWSIARNKFIGTTNPENAQNGSIRRELLEQKTELGLDTVNSGWNGVHLSAGPVEGLVELVRYNSDFTTGKNRNMEEFSFGKMLIQNFSEKQAANIIANESVSYNNKQVSAFDLTEEKNSDEAIDILKSVWPIE